MSESFYEKPNVFVSVGTPGRMIKLRPVNGGPKKLFIFENYRLEFSPQQAAYRDELLRQCEENGPEFPVQPMDRRRADIIARAHARAASTTLNASMNKPSADGESKAALLSIAANMLRQSGQTPQSVAEAMGLEVSELYELQQDDTPPPGTVLSDVQDDNVTDVENVKPEIHVVKPTDNPLSAMLSATGRQSTKTPDLSSTEQTPANGDE